jgi:hypothetical protein
MPNDLNPGIPFITLLSQLQPKLLATEVDARSRMSSFSSALGESVATRHTTLAQSFSSASGDKKKRVSSGDSIMFGPIQAYLHLPDQPQERKTSSGASKLWISTTRTILPGRLSPQRYPRRRPSHGDSLIRQAAPFLFPRLLVLD